MPRKSMIQMSALGAFALLSCLLFMFYKIGGSWSFALEERGIKLAAIGLTAVAIAVSTLIFQTLTQNRILTPSVMGLDSLYMLFQTLLVFFIGSNNPLMANKNINFIATLVLMIAFSFMLYHLLFRRERVSIYFLLLLGIVFGTLFQNGSSFMQMLIDPNEFLIVQGKMFASFNSVNGPVLGMASIVLILSLVYLAYWFKYLDVLRLGKDQAINLGVPYFKLARHLLIIVSIMVSVATALVGPVTFLGLLVVNVTYQLFDTYRHKVLIPGAILLSIIALVFGQWMVERIFTFNTTLSVIINFIGGAYFIYLLIKESRG
ncbi:iron chelate uptake ABC transporter family permease subunit [Terrilactibacillus laevilacticus]|uniref:Iron chelate uptake ABC transporter family permease subunit n=1 Tax=Terrilactibacillus laevilacticus TaxID=1380157 RepID=A0ABW5PNC2_9BACI|nr:iron chelate uptake ABC transporter family permease subunit [Terrilactibacillus laevilacticus]